MCLGCSTCFDILPFKRVLSVKKDHIKQSVEVLVYENETTDPYRLARQMGIQVDEHSFGRIRGMVFEIAGQVTIILNSALPDWLKRVVLAHVLGHLSCPRAATAISGQPTTLSWSRRWNMRRTSLRWSY